MGVRWRKQKAYQSQPENQFFGPVLTLSLK